MMGNWKKWQITWLNHQAYSVEEVSILRLENLRAESYRNMFRSMWVRTILFLCVQCQATLGNAWLKSKMQHGLQFSRMKDLNSRQAQNMCNLLLNPLSKERMIRRNMKRQGD
jgi:hypothetical protein